MCISNQTYPHQLYAAAAVQQPTTLKAIADTAASGNYGPVSAQQAGVLLPRKPIKVTCANEINM